MNQINTTIQNTNVYNNEKKINIAERQKDRILSLDVLKGIAIILVILSHVAYFTLKEEDIWMYWTIFILLDVFGPSLFVFLSAQGVVFSYIKKKNELNELKAVRKTTFRRAYAIILIGWIYNAILNFFNPKVNYGIFGFWYWHILQFIGFSQIFTYIALKFKKYKRIIFTIIIFLISYPLFYFITGKLTDSGLDYRFLSLNNFSNQYALIYFLIFDPFWLSPLLPWLAYPFISSVIGEMLVNSIKKDNENSKYNFVKNTFIIGLILIIIGIGTGLNRIKYDYSQQFMWQIIQERKWNFLNYWEDGIPTFLIHGTFQFMLYNLGMAIILISITFYLTEIKRKRGKLIRVLSFYGLVSLSIFIYHQILAVFVPFKVEPWLMFVLWIIITILVGKILYILVFRFRGIGTLEFLVIIAGGLKRIKSKLEKQNQLIKDNNNKD